MGLSTADIAGMQAIANTVMPDTCTNLRTGLATKCRVSDDVSSVRLEGLPRWLPLRRYRIVQPLGTDAKPTDQLQVTGMGAGIYLAFMTVSHRTWGCQVESYSLGSAAPVLAETFRDPDYLEQGQTSGPSQHLSQITIFPVGDYLMQPVSQQFMSDTFGSTSAVTFRCCVQYPQPSAWADPTKVGEEYPIALDDMIVLASGQQYIVTAVERWAPNFIIPYVEIRESPANTVLSTDERTLGGIVLENGDVIQVPPS